MNELQKTELEILKTFISICDRLNLRYYLVCGTALGAVKYGGFIPWDDDMDVALPREDYRIFCKKAPSLLPSHYFLQNYRTDPAFPCIYSKLRDSRTTYVEANAADLPIHHGVYIDVFPLDGYPEKAAEAATLERKKQLMRLMLASAFRLTDGHSLKAKMFLTCARLLGCHRHTHKTVQRLEQLLSRWPAGGSQTWCNHGNWQGQLEYAPWQQYGDGAWFTFEGLKVRVPEQFDAYLTQKYGNWREDPPQEQQIGHHGYAVCDVARPYSAYIETLPNGKIRIRKNADV